jgi:hypothetical protein
VTTLAETIRAEQCGAFDRADLRTSHAAVGALALAARRQGAPRLEWIFVGLAAVLLLGGHPFPAGTLAFACFFAAALLHELRGSS